MEKRCGDECKPTERCLPRISKLLRQLGWRVGQLDQTKLTWQSKLVLLLVLPGTAAGLVLQTHWWVTQLPSVAIWTVGASVLLALVVLKLRAATVAGVVTGAVITASLMFSTV